MKVEDSFIVEKMASTTITEHKYSFENLKDYPPVINGRINALKFLEATAELLRIVESLGKLFAPVRYDMEGNITKIKKLHVTDKSCLLELMLDECSKGKPVATEGLLWLNRTLCFFEILFQEILLCLGSNNVNVNMRKIYTTAYEGSVQKYHNWVTQQIFALICRLSPTLLQLLKVMEADTDIAAFTSRLTSFNVTLHLVRCKIDDFYKDNDLLSDK